MDGRRQRAVRHGIEIALGVFLLGVLLWVAHALGVPWPTLRPVEAQPPTPTIGPVGAVSVRTTVKAVLQHGYPVSMGAWAPDERRLAVGGRLNATVTVWDVERAVTSWVVDALGPVAAIAWAPDGRLLATAQEHTEASRLPASVRIWNGTTGHLAREVRPGGEPGRYSANAVAWRPDGARLAVALDARKTIEVFDSGTGRPLQSISGFDKLSSDLAWSQDGRRLAFGTWGRRGPGQQAFPLIVIDAGSGQELWASPGADVWFLSVAFSPDGRQVAAQRPGAVQVFDAARGTLLHSLAMIEVGGKRTVRFSADGRLLVAGGGGALVWSTRAWDVLARIALPGHPVHFVALSPSGRYLALGGLQHVTVLELSR